MNIKRCHTRLVIVSSLVIAAIPMHSQARDNGQLSEITITAAKEDATQSTSQSMRVKKVGQEEVAQQQATSVPQLVNNLANVTAVGGPRENAQEVNIRGLDHNRVLQLVDGVRQNFVSGHRPTYFLDPALIKDIELQKGPSSAIWGSGAIGGVISQNTIHARDLLDTGDTFGGFVRQGYQSNNDLWLTTAALAGRYENMDLLVSSYYRDGNEVELGDGNNLENSADRDKGVLAKLDWFIDDSQSSTFTYRRGYSEGGVPVDGSTNANTSNFLVDRETQVDQASIDYYLNPDNSLIDTKLTLYWTRTQIDDPHITDARVDTTEMNTYGINLNNESHFKNLAVLYGFDGYQDKFEGARSGENRPIIPDATTDVWGAFTTVHIPLAERWKAEIGARYDYFATEAKNLNTSRSDNALSPSAALIWEATPKLNVSVRYDQAFRAPTAEELYQSGTHFCIIPGMPGGCNTFIANPNLKPEESENIEFLADYTFDKVFTDSDSLKVSANVFHNDVDNFIDQEVENPVFTPFPFSIDAGNTTYNNVDKAEIQGFELEASYAFGTLNSTVSYGQSRGQNEKTGEALATIPADKWVWQLNKAWLQNSLKTGVTLTRVESQKHLAIGETNEYDHYTLVDLYASWTPQSAKDVTVDLTVNNLTDQYYRVANQQLYMPGKDIRLGIKYAF